MAYVAGETFGVIVVNGTTGWWPSVEYLVAVLALTALAVCRTVVFRQHGILFGDPAK